MPEPAPPPISPTDPRIESWTALAFDFGRRRIGLAIADSVTRTARAIGVVQSSTDAIDWPAIERQVAQLQPRYLVVGLPFNADGTPGALTAAVESFARELQTRFKLAVATVDERWSSLEASERLKSERQSGLRTSRVRREDVDAKAASIILERWLDQTCSNN